MGLGMVGEAGVGGVVEADRIVWLVLRGGDVTGWRKILQVVL